VLGVTFGLAVTVGNTIGAGILRAPGEVAAHLPSVGWYLAAWVAGGLYALLGAVSVAELGTMIPRSGGMYVFARRALGPYAGFVVGWNDWIATAGSCAAVAVVAGEYTGALVPALAGRGTAVGCAVVLAFAALQWRGVRPAGRTQEVTSLLKAVVLLGLVAACLWLPATAPAARAAPLLPSGAGLALAFVLAMQSVIYTYDGWTGVIYFGGEVRDPARDVPRSIFGGVLAVTAIYLLVNLAFLRVLPPGALAGESFAAGAAARAVLGPEGDTAVRAVLVVALLSSVNALVLMAPRVLWAMSADGLFHRRGAAVNAGGTPATALAASTAVALVFILTGTFDAIIAALAFFFVANYTLCFASVFVLRRREPDAPRPYRAWGYPWTTGLALLGSLVFLAGTLAGDPRNSGYALLVLAVSWPVYRLARKLQPSA
jgi:APA family basic amino acid/polyamine antiporter